MRSAAIALVVLLALGVVALPADVSPVGAASAERCIAGPGSNCLIPIYCLHGIQRCDDGGD